MCGLRELTIAHPLLSQLLHIALIRWYRFSRRYIYNICIYMYSDIAQDEHGNVDCATQARLTRARGGRRVRNRYEFNLALARGEITGFSLSDETRCDIARRYVRMCIRNVIDAFEIAIGCGASCKAESLLLRHRRVQTRNIVAFLMCMRTHVCRNNLR